MGSSNFLPFNPTATNQESDAAYLADSQRAGGYGVDNIVPSALLNKVQYQASIFCAAFGQMMAAKPGAYSLNDASQSALAAVLSNILTESDLGTNLVSVAYSPTPTFNATSTNGFQMALTGNITSSAIMGVSIGQLIAFYFSQDSAGGRTVAWPASMVGTIQPDPAPNAVSVMLFRADLSGNLRAVSPMISNNGVFFGAATANVSLKAPTVSSSDNSTNVATTAWSLLGFSASISSTGGRVRLPTWLGGWMLQWGQAGPLPTGGSNASISVSFSASFGSTPQVFCQTNNRADNQDGSAPYVLNAGPIGISTSGFTAIATCNTEIGGHGAASISNTVYVNWFAIGI